MDIFSWGDILFNSNNIYIIKKYKSNAIYYINILEEYMEVKMKIENRNIFEWIDYPDLKSESPLCNFKRTIKGHTHHIVNGIFIAQTQL